MKGILALVVLLILALLAYGENGQLLGGVEREIVPNLDVRNYHVSKSISESPFQIFWVPMKDFYRGDLEEVGEVGTGLVGQVFAIQGVTDVIIKPYELSVIIAPAFDWKDVEPYVLNALHRALRKMELSTV